MRPSTPSALRAIHHHRYSKACPSVSNRHSNRTKPPFLAPRRPAKQQDDPSQVPEPAWSHVVEEPANLPRSGNNSKEAEERIAFSEGGPNTPGKAVDKSNYGSAMNRLYRNAKKPKDIPTLHIPQWFLDSNVILREAISSKVNSQHVHPKKPEISPIEQQPPTAISATLERLKASCKAELGSEKLEPFLTEEPSISVKPAAEQNAEEEGPDAGVQSGNSEMSSTERSSVPVVLDSVESRKIWLKKMLSEMQKLDELQELANLQERVLREIISWRPKVAQDKMEPHGTNAKIKQPDQVDDRIMREVTSLVSAGLESFPAQYTNDWTSSKSDLVLFCPVNGGSFFLDELVLYLASVNGTDLVRLDPQDIAEIGGNYLEQRRDTHTCSLSSLGYDAYRQSSEHAAKGEPPKTEDSEDHEREAVDLDFGRSRSRPMASVIALPLGSHLGGLIQSALGNGSPSLIPNSVPHGMGRAQTANVTSDLKMEQFVETVLEASGLKRAAKYGKKDLELTPEANASTSEISTDNNSGITPSSNKRTDSLIVMVRDYLEINSTFAGAKVLEKLHEVVRRRRKDGQRILVIGTSSSRELISNLSKSRLRQTESEPNDGPTRTIMVPCRDRPLKNSRRRRMGLINLRNLQDMLRRLAPSSLRIDLISEMALDSDPLLPLPSERNKVLSLLGQRILPLDSVHFAATVTLGLSQDQDQITVKDVLRALSTRSASEDAKLEWMDREKEHEKTTNILSSKPHLPLTSKAAEQRMSKLRRICNTHETRLLSGVVDAGNIRTTFANVQAPPETIEALKTLTTLSLVRPDAFTYGVLATDKIPGLLLYGPPGTGKTLLAKAVAKESGATVLEVSGSDIYDMYVGEGEKNIKAVFSLAKKLTPCIVFIDEADAILGSRGGSSPRTSHRELINQFLREWDGMNDHSAFIMVATNRPYDLDEACLRRLPRRLLVDLPTEQDREAILRIHLKDEGLDPTVSLPTLASQTPFYSGSDLKNVAVAAALSCVREEVQQVAPALIPSSVQKETDQGADAAASSSEKISPSQCHTYPKSPYPEKRTLLPRHFACALEEISASISEDMGSLNAIRKFDEKYGDRRGKRKGQGYGFNTVKEGERKRSDAARVRNR